MLMAQMRSIWARTPIIPILCCLFGLVAGYLAIIQPKVALVLIGAGILLALAARSPVSIALLVAPASFNVSRLSIGHGIALPDILLAVATIFSFPALARLGTPRGVTSVRRWFAVYVVAMVVIVALHPSGRSIGEAIHRTLLVGGALNVGAWIYLEGRSRLALRILIGTAVVVGAFCIGAGAIHGFRSPAQPLGLNKNYVGSVLGLSMLVTLAAPGELRMSQTLRNVCLVVMGGGLAATHSRAAMLGLVLGIFVWFFRTHSDYRRRSFIFAAILAAGFLLYASYLVKGQLADQAASQNTNSVAVRNKTESATIKLWRGAPIVGVGIYYYNDPSYQEMNHFLVAPTNMVVEALAEGGIVLAAGLIIFNVGAISVMLRYRNPLVVAGLALVADRIGHGMVDIFWTAGNTSLPWLVVGMGMAQAAVTGRNAPVGRYEDEVDLPVLPFNTQP
jgi:hypothetical protein